VELALRDRHHEITKNKQHIQLRSPAQLWHKENLLNIAISRLPADWEYVAWIDSDIIFTRPDWVNETLHKLQHYHVIQMFSHAIDLGPKFEPLQQFTGFVYSYLSGGQYPKRKANKSGYYYMAGGHNWHPGYAWAARRSAISDLGGLGDIGILGSSDHHMATAFIGRVDDSIHSDMSDSYKTYWHRWQDRAEKYIKRNIGFMDGLLCHYWHGNKKNRKYVDRWQILIKNKFDHELDLKKDVQGIYQLTERSISLRDDIRMYFEQRNEDSIDT
jgi:hypothetical protein